MKLRIAFGVLLFSSFSFAGIFSSSNLDWDLINKMRVMNAKARVLEGRNIIESAPGPFVSILYGSDNIAILSFLNKSTHQICDTYQATNLNARACYENWTEYTDRLFQSVPVGYRADLLWQFGNVTTDDIALKIYEKMDSESKDGTVKSIRVELADYVAQERKAEFNMTIELSLRKGWGTEVKRKCYAHLVSQEKVIVIDDPKTKQEGYINLGNHITVVNVTSMSCTSGF